MKISVYDKRTRCPTFNDEWVMYLLDITVVDLTIKESDHAAWLVQGKGEEGGSVNASPALFVR